MTSARAGRIGVLVACCVLSCAQVWGETGKVEGETTVADANAPSSEGEVERLRREVEALRRENARLREVNERLEEAARRPEGEAPAATRPTVWRPGMSADGVPVGPGPWTEEQVRQIHAERRAQMMRLRAASTRPAAER